MAGKTLDLISRFVGVDAGARAGYAGLADGAKIAAAATKDYESAQARALATNRAAADQAVKASDLRIQASAALREAQRLEAAGDTEAADAAERNAAALKLQASAARATSLEMNAAAVAAGRQAAALKANRDATVESTFNVNSLKKSSAGLSDVLEEIPTPITAAAGAVAKLGTVVAVTGLGIAAFSLDVATKFQSAMTRLETGAAEPVRDIESDSKRLLALAGPLAQSAGSMANALYPINSAGFHGAEGIKVLTDAIQGAKADGADIATVADAVTSALNAYGKGARSAKGDTNEFVKAVSLGKVPMQDLAASIGAIVPSAADLHVPLSQVLAGISTMTSTGTAATRATQGMRFALASLADPTQKAIGALKTINLTSGSLGDTITKHGLVAGFKELEDHVGDKFPKSSHQYLATLANIVGGTRGLVAVLGLTGPHMNTFASDSRKIGAAAGDAGKNVEGWGKYTKTFQYNVDSAKAGVNALAISLGEKLLPDATKAMHWIATDGVKDLDQFGHWFEENRSTIYGFGAEVVTVMKDIEFATLGTVRGLVDGMAKAFGWVPDVGPKLRTAAKAFDLFEDTTENGMTKLSNFLTNKSLEAGAATATGVAKGIDSRIGSAQGAAHNLGTAAISEANRAIGSGAVAAGRHLGAGLIGGINAERGDVGAAAGSLGALAVSEANRYMGNHSPSVLMREAGKNLDLGLAQGITANASVVAKPIHDVGKLILDGLTGGWSGMASKIKDQLTTPIQNALEKITSVTNAELSKQTAAVKSAESAYKSALSTRASDIASLQSSISGSVDISSLFGSDANGNPTTGNLGSYLSGSVAPIQTMAKDLALLRKKGLSQALLNQISSLPPSQADTLMAQILSGQDGSIASLNQSESAIQKYSKASATTVVESPAEKASIARDKHLVEMTKLMLDNLKLIVEQDKHAAARAVAHSVTVKLHGHGSFKNLSLKDGRELAKILNKLGADIHIT